MALQDGSQARGPGRLIGLTRQQSGSLLNEASLNEASLDEASLKEASLNKNVFAVIRLVRYSALFGGRRRKTKKALKLGKYFFLEEEGGT